MPLRSPKRIPDCSHSRNAAICAATTSAPDAGSRSSLRCASLSINAPPAAWLDEVGAKKSFCSTANPVSVRSARCLARLRHPHGLALPIVRAIAATGELVCGLEVSCLSSFSIEIGNERTRVPVA